jgi:hypothetical protein
VLQNAIGASANIAATSATSIHEAQIAVIIGHVSHKSWRHAAFWFMLALRGAKQEEFRHVSVERYCEFVPDRGGVFDVV